MRRITSICIIGGGDKFRQELYNHVKNDIPKEWAKKYEYSGRGQLNLPLEENSPSYQYVMRTAREHELHPSVSQIVYYTKREIEESGYFQMRILSPLELEGTDAADYGTQYEGGCPNPTCRLGKKLVGDVLVDRKFLNQKKWDIGTLRPDIYVSEKLKNLICSYRFTGLSFKHEVRDFKGREIPKYYVMEIQNVLSPMAPSTWLISDKYSHPWYEECGHQVVYLRSDIQYEEDKLESALDFNLSTEYVDNFRMQEIIVTSKVRKLFMQHKIHAGFFPVAIL